MKNFFGIPIFIVGLLGLIYKSQNPDNVSWLGAILIYGCIAWGLEMIITDLIEKSATKLREEFQQEIRDLKDNLEEALDNRVSSETTQDFEEDEEFEDGLHDELYAKAKRLVVEEGKASTAFLQRKLNVGYDRSARLIDMLEDRGVIGPGSGAKPRDVLIADENPLIIVEPPKNSKTRSDTLV